MLQEENRMTFGQRLKRLREEKSLSKTLHQKEVASAIGVSAKSYSRYESDKRQPDFCTLVRICKYFDISADYLLGLTDIPRSYK